MSDVRPLIDLLDTMDGVRAVVGWARVASLPDDAPAAPVAAACTNWGLGASATRVAGPGAAHGACAVGRLTQGFAAAPPEGDPGIGYMVESGYVDPAEFASLATLPMGHAGIAYGPVDELGLAPEALLLFADTRALMLVGEALAATRLDAPGLPLMGRPTCAAVAAAVTQGRVVASLGCTGARLHAGIRDGESLVVVPAAQFADLASRLEATMARNRGVLAMNVAAVEAVAG